MTVRAQFRRGTAGEWSAVNPVLALGEPGYETDTGKFKVGNGISSWNSLPYSSGLTGPQGNPGPQGPQGAPGSTGSLLLDELTAIYRNGSFSVGTPGQVPFGVGPVTPPAAAFHSISADAYNPVHLPSGSFC